MMLACAVPPAPAATIAPIASKLTRGDIEFTLVGCFGESIFPSVSLMQTLCPDRKHLIRMYFDDRCRPCHGGRVKNPDGRFAPAGAYRGRAGRDALFSPDARPPIRSPERLA